MNRRDFLKSSGALVVSFSAFSSSAGSVSELLAQGPPQPGRFDGPGTPQLDAWLAIGADGHVTAYTGKVELGHGLYTSQTQLIAEELCVPLARVTLIQGDTGVAPDQGTTSGSQSHPVNFNDGGLALAGATAREALLQMASQRMGVPATLLRVNDGVISGAGRGSVTYAELIGGKKFNLTLNPNAKRKPASEWTILGAPVPRLDVPALVTGQFEFVHNLRFPEMLHGRVVRPPDVGATLVRVDESSVNTMPGFVKVVVKKNFVGVVAEKPWQATQMASRLKVEWTKGAGLPNQATFSQYLRDQKPARDSFVVNSKDVDDKIAKAGESRQGDVPPRVPDARIDRHVVRGRGREERQGDDLVGDAVRVSHAQHRRDAARHEAGRRPRDLHDGCGLLRSERRRHGVVRRRVDVAGGRADRCACSSRARTRWRGRTTAPRT